jgi:hypothetical protein
MSEHVIATAEVLDLRELAAPEPMVRALEAIDALPPGRELVVLTPLMPVPLLERLGSMGHDVHAELMADGTARLHVRTAS